MFDFNIGIIVKVKTKVSQTINNKLLRLLHKGIRSTVNFCVPFDFIVLSEKGLTIKSNLCISLEVIKGTINKKQDT